jgi:hypothetical protein
LIRFGQPQPDQTGGGEDDRIVVTGIELPQTRIEIAAQAPDLELRIARAQHGFAPQAGRTDHGIGRQLGEPGKPVRDESITRILTHGDGGQAKPSGISIGRSFIECTARSARPCCMATSSSLMNKPLPPIAASGRSRI